MAGGSILEDFTMLAASEGPAWASGPDTLVNEAVKSTYTLPRITSGKQMTDMVQGGDMITDTVYFEVQSTFNRYNQNAEFDYSIPQHGTTWTVPWAFAAAWTAWTKAELGLNKNTMTQKYRAQKYKSVLFQKYQNLWTDVCNSIDAEFWAEPDESLMESSSPSGARIPYSLAVFINEMSDASGALDTPFASASLTPGLPDVSTASQGNWTTVMGINPATYTKWQNQRETYTYDGTTAVGAAGVFRPMQKLLRKCRFDRLPKRPEYSDKTTSPHVILTQGAGLDNYEHALRLNQDTFRGVGMTSGQDPAYDKPTFRRIPLDWIEELDTATIFPTGENSTTPTFSTYDDTTNTDNTTTAEIGHPGARYYFVNGEYLSFVVHSENYCDLTEPFRPSKQPFTRVQVMDLWNNHLARSRMRQGILHPSAALSGGDL